MKAISILMLMIVFAAVVVQSSYYGYLAYQGNACSVGSPVAQFYNNAGCQAYNATHYAKWGCVGNSNLLTQSLCTDNACQTNCATFSTYGCEQPVANISVLGVCSDDLPSAPSVDGFAVISQYASASCSGDIASYDIVPTGTCIPAPGGGSVGITCNTGAGTANFSTNCADYTSVPLNTCASGTKIVCTSAPGNTTAAATGTTTASATATTGAAATTTGKLTTGGTTAGSTTGATHAATGSSSTTSSASTTAISMLVLAVAALLFCMC